MKATAIIPTKANVASKPGVLVVVVVDLVVLVGSVAGAVLVVVVVDLLESEPGAGLVVVIVDLVASEPGVVLVVVVVDLVTSPATLRASSIIVAISIATNIFFILKPHFLYFSCELYESRLLHLDIHNVFRAITRNLKLQAVIPQMCLQI